MRAINRFIRLHPVWATVIGMIASLLMIVSCIWGGVKINKHIHPNNIYYSEEGLICNDIQYEYLDDQKWELLEVPEYSLGKFYSGKNSLVPLGEFCSFSSDPEKVFIKDVGQFLQYSYVREDKKPNVYDSSQIEAIALELGDLNRSTIEIKKEEDIIKFVSFVESVEKNQVVKSEMTGTYNNSMNLNLKIKNHPVIYKVGTIYEEETTGEWVISIGFTPSYDMNYPLPENLGTIIHSTIEKASE